MKKQVLILGSKKAVIRTGSIGEFESVTYIDLYVNGGGQHTSVNDSDFFLCTITENQLELLFTQLKIER